MGPTRMRLSKPVIAAVEGYAVAGGCELALWCDLRVASQTAIFGIFCRRFGVPLIDLGTIRLPRLIGHSRAMDLILTGREVRAQEAFDIGLANRARAGRRSADCSDRARASDRVVPADLHAQRSTVGDRAVGHGRRRSDAQRIPARHGHDGQRRERGRRERLREGRRPAWASPRIDRWTSSLSPRSRAAAASISSTPPSPCDASASRRTACA